MRRQHDVTLRSPPKKLQQLPAKSSPGTNHRPTLSSPTPEATRIMLYKSTHDLQVLTPYTSIGPEDLYYLRLLQL